MLTKELPTETRVPLRFIEPMYAEAVSGLPEGSIWTYEAKLDGYRCLAAKQGNKVDLWSRRGTSFKSRWPEIARAFEMLPADTLIDGEVVAIGADGKVSFNALQHSRSGAHLQFYAFDILVHRGESALRLPLEKRRERLTTALAKIDYPVIQSSPFDAKPADLIRAAHELGMEGIVAKRKGSLYEPGRRSGAWLKYRINCSQEFVIGGYTHGHPFDALIVGVYDDSGLKFVEKVRAGFVGHMRAEIHALMKPLAIESCPFVNLPEKRRTAWSLTAEEMKNCCWVQPELVAQIEFQEWTPDGHLRHSSFAGLREDKDPLTIIRE
jgi:bifunctional non-homologous end joining protein LigD